MRSRDGLWPDERPGRAQRTRPGGPSALAQPGVPWDRWTRRFRKPGAAREEEGRASRTVSPSGEQRLPISPRPTQALCHRSLVPPGPFPLSQSPWTLWPQPARVDAGLIWVPDGGRCSMEMRGDWGQAGFEVLEEHACLEMLERGTVGRVGVSMESIPVILTVNYHFADGAIHFRTGEGSKLAAATRNAVVAFQIDEIDSVYHAGWSVLAVGMAKELKEPGDLAWASRLPLRAWAPGIREHFVRIVPEVVLGRRIIPGHSEPQPWP